MWKNLFHDEIDNSQNKDVLLCILKKINTSSCISHCLFLKLILHDGYKNFNHIDFIQGLQDDKSIQHINDINKQ